ncbi:MAG: cytochrome c-type biogenesis CcmF C-terminal domain-containing protein [Anaerolineae bacterium]
MLAELGLVACLLAFIAALYAIIASVYGERVARSEAMVISGRNAVYVVFVMLTVSIISLQIALMTQQYQIAYVWQVSSPDMPDFFRFTALWGSQSGSILFWSFLMSVFAAAATALNWRSQRRLMPYAIAYMMATVAFFVGLTLFLENPFNRWWLMPDGSALASAFIPAGAVAPSLRNLSSSAQGLNPLLRHFGMAIHPPMLYLGFVGFVIPFSFAMAALASGDLSTNWIKVSRRWALIAWLFLSLGLLLGGRWAYDVLGWGGYWGWDPVENAAFLPWLIGTAYLHSVMIQEKRGMLKTWNMFLVIGTFSAVIFATFATRSGLVDSVHSFTQSGIGFPMFAFWLTLTLVSVGLILWRRGRGELKDDHPFGSVFSREALFVLNNFVFVALFVAIFWGSFGAPIISEQFMGTNITLGADYFERVTPPLFILALYSDEIAPVSACVASLGRMGKAMLIPLALTALCVGAFVVSGISNIGALIGYGIIILAGWIAVVETARGIQARQRVHKENPLASFWRLITRNPRRYGGYLIHIGITVIGIGVIGSQVFQQETQRTLSVGQSLELNGYTMRYDRLLSNQVAEDGRVMDIAELTLLRDGQELAHLRPRRDFFPETEGMNTMTIAGAYSTLENDFYVLLVNWEPVTNNTATFKVYINPLINLVWWGGLILIVGTLLAGYPRESMPARVRQRVQLAQQGARS